MSVVVDLSQLRAEQILFGYSPGQEALHSLHVLLDAKHHPLHIAWSLETRRRIGPELRAEIEQFEFLLGNRLPILWDVRRHPGMRTFHEEIDELRRRDPCGFRLMLFGFLGTAAADLDSAFDEAVRVAPGVEPVLRQAMADPTSAQERFADMLQTYWEVALADRWPSIEERFSRDIERRGHLLFRRGIAAGLADLSPEIRVDGSLRLLIQRPREQADQIVLQAQDRLFLAPSFFTWPHSFIHLSSPNTLISYPVLEQQQEGRPPVPPERLLQILRAAGEMTRLQILQLVNTRPRSTTELAGLLRLSEAAVSKHLRQMQEAGLVVAERQSYYVFYRMAEEPLRELTAGLADLLGQGQESD